MVWNCQSVGLTTHSLKDLEWPSVLSMQLLVVCGGKLVAFVESQQCPISYLHKHRSMLTIVVSLCRDRRELNSFLSLNSGHGQCQFGERCGRVQVEIWCETVRELVWSLPS